MCCCVCFVLFFLVLCCQFVLVLCFALVCVIAMLCLVYLFVCFFKCVVPVCVGLVSACQALLSDGCVHSGFLRKRSKVNRLGIPAKILPCTHSSKLMLCSYKGTHPVLHVHSSLRLSVTGCLSLKVKSRMSKRKCECGNFTSCILKCQLLKKKKKCTWNFGTKKAMCAIAGFNKYVVLAKGCLYTI